MVEQQLVDYIKKAKQAGQSDQQTRDLLLKNGWTEDEVNEAFSAVNRPEPQSRPQTQPQPQIKSQARPQLVDYINKARRDGAPDEQSRSFLLKNGWTDEELNSAFDAAERAQPRQEHQVSGQPEIKIQPEAATQPQTQYKAQPQLQQSQYEPQRSGGVLRIILKIFVILFLLAVIGAGGYFAITQQSSIKNFFGQFFTYSVEIVPPVETTVENPQKTPETAATEPTTKNMLSVPEDYDASKIIVAAFNEAGDRAVYCAPLKADNTKISCFSNSDKLIDSPYSFKPYWIGLSPNGQRIIFLYYDSVLRQSFVFENSKESGRFEGTITSPKFSDDSQNFMYTVIGKDNKNFVVLNGKPGVPHDKIYTVPKFSSDGKYVLYGARDGQNILWVADEIK